MSVCCATTSTLPQTDRPAGQLACQPASPAHHHHDDLPDFAAGASSQPLANSSRPEACLTGVRRQWRRPELEDRTSRPESGAPPGAGQCSQPPVWPRALKLPTGRVSGPAGWMDGSGDGSWWNVAPTAWPMMDEMRKRWRSSVSQHSGGGGGGGGCCSRSTALINLWARLGGVIAAFERLAH